MLTRLLQPLGLADPHRARIEQLAREFERYNTQLKETTTGQSILASDAAEQKASLLAMLAWHDRTRPERSLVSPDWNRRWCMLGSIFDLLRRRLPLDHAEVAAVLDWAVRQGHPHHRGSSHLVRVLADYLEHDALTPALRTLALALADQWQTAHPSPSDHRPSGCGSWPAPPNCRCPLPRVSRGRRRPGRSWRPCLSRTAPPGAACSCSARRPPARHRARAG